MAMNLHAAARKIAAFASFGSKVTLFAVLLGCGAVFAQSMLPAAPNVPLPAPPPVISTPPPASVPPPPCIQPFPMVEWEDYKGPYADVVAFFGKKLEIKSSSPHGAIYKTGSVLCTLTTKGKAKLFVSDFTNPVTFVGAAFNAGIGQAQNGDPRFGQGFDGYAKRFGANVVDQASGAFFKDLFYPTIFSQDPRYYRLGRGSVRRRIIHAVSHTLVAHDDQGAPSFNYTEWLGTATTVALSSTYHGYSEHGVAPYVEGGAIGIANDAGFDILREFWPDIVRKLKLPFRTPRPTS